MSIKRALPLAIHAPNQFLTTDVAGTGLNHYGGFISLGLTVYIKFRQWLPTL